MTRSGPLDLLGMIGDHRGYGELLSRSREMSLGTDLRVKVLNLEALIEIKEEVGHEKDRAVLPILKRTLSERRGTSGPIGEDDER